MLGVGNIVSKPSRVGGGRRPHYDNDPASNLPFEMLQCIKVLFINPANLVPGVQNLS